MREVIVTPDEIRTAFETTMAGSFPFKSCQRNAFASSVERWRAADDTFAGVSGREMLRMLVEGWTPEGDAPDLDMGASEIDVPMVELVEEDGELLFDQVLNGEDLMFARWENVKAPRGLTIRANVDFNAGTPAEIIKRFYAWILRTVDAAQRRGIAPDIELFYGTKDTFDDGEEMRLVIPLVKAGELIDVASWRAFLHGGAFRTLGFAAIALAGDKLGKTVKDGLGYAVGSSWDVALSDDDVLTIDSPGMVRDFPEDAMTAKVEAALA